MNINKNPAVESAEILNNFDWKTSSDIKQTEEIYKIDLDQNQNLSHSKTSVQSIFCQYPEKRKNLTTVEQINHQPNKKVIPPQPKLTYGEVLDFKTNMIFKKFFWKIGIYLK